MLRPHGMINCMILVVEDWQPPQGTVFWHTAPRSSCPFALAVSSRTPWKTLLRAVLYGRHVRTMLTTTWCKTRACPSHQACRRIVPAVKCSIAAVLSNRLRRVSASKRSRERARLSLTCTLPTDPRSQLSPSDTSSCVRSRTGRGRGKRVRVGVPSRRLSDLHGAASSPTAKTAERGTQCTRWSSHRIIFGGSAKPEPRSPRLR